MPMGFFVHFWRLRLGAYWSGDMLLICFCLTLASCFVFWNCSVSLIVFVRSVYWLVPRPFSRLSVEVATSSPGSSSAWPCRAQQGRDDPGNEVVLVAAQVAWVSGVSGGKGERWKRGLILRLRLKCCGKDHGNNCKTQTVMERFTLKSL